MAEINLLPLDLSPARRIFKLADNLKRLSYVILGAFLLVGTLGVVYIVFLRIQINSSVNKQEQLIKSIAGLESTEQKLYLTKDRIKKIKPILSDTKKADTFGSMSAILLSLPGDVTPYSLEVDNNRSRFSVVSKSSIAMADFFNSLVINGGYKKLDLVSFIFTPDKGYLITFGGAQ
jgi:Tfp pilus assembly protein PilN